MYISRIWTFVLQCACVEQNCVPSARVYEIYYENGHGQGVTCVIRSDSHAHTTLPTENVERLQRSQIQMRFFNETTGRYFQVRVYNCTAALCAR